MSRVKQKAVTTRYEMSRQYYLIPDVYLLNYVTAARSVLI